MRRIMWLVVLALMMAWSHPAPAAVSVTRLEGFNKTWQFINTNTAYDEILESGYYKDYNGDGLADYLVCLSSKTTHNTRIFTFNTSATGGDKTYADKTAGRDFTAAAGSFVPQKLFTPRAPKDDTPDLVLVGANSGGINGYENTNFTFHRLKKSDTAWPTETQWTITLPFRAFWVVMWAEESFDDDDYPDIYIFNSVAPSANRRFVLGVYNGRTGAQIWQKTLNLDPADTQSGIPEIISTSGLIAFPLPLLSVNRVGNGDFDNNGKPEFMLYYTYSIINIMNGTTANNFLVNVLDSNGNPLPPYTSAWTRLSPVDTPSAVLPAVISDYDQDGYRDLMLHNPSPILDPSIPVFRGYSLKKRQFLFSSTNSDFGSGTGDSDDFRTFDAMSFGRYSPTDVTGDSRRDLHLFRDKGLTSDAEGNPIALALKVGLFHTMAGGRKVWLSPAATFANFDRAHMIANDFNYDGLMDFLLFKNPASASNPTWTLGNTACTATGISLGKQFNYTSSATGVLGVDQEFGANSVTAGNIGDMDGNGQRDTWASMEWEITESGDTVKAGGSAIVYNTPPPSSSSPAARYAALDVLVSNQDLSPILMMKYAHQLNRYGFVDNDKDNVTDDVLAWFDGGVFALNFKASGSFPLDSKAELPTPPHGGSVTVGQPLRWEPAGEGAYADTSYDVYLGTSQTAVINAMKASAEFKGNLVSPLYLPRPALTPGVTYYWRVDVYNPWGKVTKGNVWRIGAQRNAINAWRAFE